MEQLSPEVMIRQVEHLASDLRYLSPAVEEQIRALVAWPEWRAVQQVYLIGSGDSYHASLAAEMAFEAIADLTCRTMSALRFLEYGASWMRQSVPRQTLVVATSASGTTKLVIQAVERAKEHGAMTLALTGESSSLLSEVADRTIVVELARKERSPGIRTYQASLFEMLMLAIQLGEGRSRYLSSEADLLRLEISALAEVLHAMTGALKDRCREVGEMIARSAGTVIVGSGPNYGTALFGSAKLIEAAGIFAVGQDLEEWWHVERFAYPDDMPLFVIGPPGRSHWRALEIAAAGCRLGRRVIAVADKDDIEMTHHCHVLLPIPGRTREEFSPLLYHVFASYTAAFVTERLGRRLFQSDKSKRLESL